MLIEEELRILTRPIRVEHRIEHHHLGLIPEDELNEQRRPGGKWAVTAKPIITPEAATFTDAVTVEIACPTEGASIAYTTDDGDKPHWKLYSRPFRFTKPATIRAKACRLGYKDSPIAKAVFQVSSADSK